MFGWGIFCVYFGWLVGDIILIMYDWIDVWINCEIFFGEDFDCLKIFVYNWKVGGLIGGYYMVCCIFNCLVGVN